MALTKVTGNLIAGGNNSLVDADKVDGLDVSSTNVVSTIVSRDINGDTAARNLSLAGTLTVTGKTTTRNFTIQTSNPITPTIDTADTYEVSFLATAATVGAPIGTPQANQRLLLKIKDNGNSRNLTWTTTVGGYRPIEVGLPSNTTIGKVLYVGCIYNATDNYWDVLAVAQL
jgi:hypothetical protein